MEEVEKTQVRDSYAANGNESVHTKSVSTDQTVSGPILAQRIVYYIGGAILVLLGVRFLLLLFGASRASGFVDFIYSLSGIFVAPFQGIFSEPRYGTAKFDTATLVAMVVYALLTIGIAKLFTLGRRDRDVA